MRNDLQYRRDGTTNCCSICGRPFGLIRYYSWRTPLCSKKCVERFKARQKLDRNWLFLDRPGEQISLAGGIALTGDVELQA